jgi:hypothetical protein
VAQFVGGDLQARFMARVRDVDPCQCLVVPVDVGKWSAMALVADHHGEVVRAPLAFRLDEPGVRSLLSLIVDVVSDVGAVVCRVGVESAGHYHRTLVARLRSSGVEVVELNPAAVKEARSQQLLRRLKSDERDLGAMAELMIRGAGRLPQVRDDAMAAQAAWVGHRRRKVAAHVALSNQVQGHLDLVFPGLGACFDGIWRTKAGRVIVRDLADRPDAPSGPGRAAPLRRSARCRASTGQGRRADRRGERRVAVASRGTCPDRRAAAVGCRVARGDQ